jgi:branched-chain amino acid transport system substrate-binding protein
MPFTLTRRAALAGAAGLGFARGPAAAEAPLTLGVLTDVSSSFSEISGAGSIEAARMAIADFGAPVALRSADHQGKTDIGVAIARQWYDEGVDAIFDISNSSISFAVQQMAREKDRLVVHTGSTSTDLTGKACSPVGFSWGYDTYSMTHGAPEAAMAGGRRSWFILTWDYTVGHAFQRDLTDAVTKAGGRVLGTVRAPLGTTDYSSFLLQAHASGAELIAVLVAGADLVNAVKQAHEYRLGAGGQSLVLPVAFIQDIHAIGLAAAQGALMSLDFYWDQTDATRGFAQRFFAKMGKMPSRNHALVYSAATHVMKAARAAGSRSGARIADAMRAMPVQDFFTHGARIREDGKLMRDMYLFEVKQPAESRYAWDYLRFLATIPADRAFRPLAEGGCPLART